MSYQKLITHFYTIPQSSYHFFFNTALHVSSTEIREKIRKGEDLTGLVPEKVYCYIRERKLYGYK